MAVKFFECKQAEDMETKINQWAEMQNHEIVSVSLTTKTIGYSNYIVACVIYKKRNGV